MNARRYAKPERHIASPHASILTRKRGRHFRLFGDPPRSSVWGERSPNIESVLSRLRVKIDACGEGDMPLGLSRCALRSLETAIRKQIAILAQPDESSFPANLPHDQFALWYVRRLARSQLRYSRQTTIFCSNGALERQRDSLVMASLAALSLLSSESVEDDALLPGPMGALWKLHGSVNWAGSADGRRIVRRAPSLEGEMILPSHRKYDESRKQPVPGLCWIASAGLCPATARCWWGGVQFWRPGTSMLSSTQPSSSSHESRPGAATL